MFSLQAQVITPYATLFHSVRDTDYPDNLEFDDINDPGWGGGIKFSVFSKDSRWDLGLDINYARSSRKYTSLIPICNGELCQSQGLISPDDYPDSTISTFRKDNTHLLRIGLEPSYAVLRNTSAEVLLGINAGYTLARHGRYYESINTNTSYGNNYFHFGPMARLNWYINSRAGLMFCLNPTFLTHHFKNNWIDATPPSNLFANYLQVGINFRLNKSE